MRHLKRFLRTLLSPALLPMAKILARLLESEKDIEAFFKVFRRHGFYLLRSHFYLPIPDDDDMTYTHDSELVGVDMNDESQLRFNTDVILKYKPEFLRFPVDSTDDPHQFHLVNGTFMAGDGHAYYSLIRHLKPAMIIEIGSGKSTLLAGHAIDKNIEESPEYECRFVAVEPYPAHYLSTLPRLGELRRSKLQNVDPDYFAQLAENDILFIDSSHVLKTGGDVWLEYCEIIPRLNSGVYVHVHDISLPKPYPSVYYDAHRYWNEQYLLQALLTNNDRLEVIWAGTYLFNKYTDQMKAAFSPEYDSMRAVYPLAEPSSFWVRVR